MTLARRHFDSLAQKLKMARRRIHPYTSPDYRDGGMHALDIMERSLIYFCEAESPTFDRAKFQETARL